LTARVLRQLDADGIAREQIGQRLNRPRLVLHHYDLPRLGQNSLPLDRLDGRRCQAWPVKPRDDKGKGFQALHNYLTKSVF